MAGDLLQRLDSACRCPDHYDVMHIDSIVGWNSASERKMSAVGIVNLTLTGRVAAASALVDPFFF